MRFATLFLFFHVCLFADITALLLQVDNNAQAHFSYEDSAFSCKHAAIITLTQLYHSKNSDTSCQRAIEGFIKKHPYISYEAKAIFHTMQKYHLIAFKKACFVMLNGGVSFSEHLLEKGYAMLDDRIAKSQFSKTALYAKLLEAQNRAQYHQKGIWSNQVVVNCFVAR